MTQPNPKRGIKLTPRGVLAGAALAALESSEYAETVPLLPRLDVILLIVAAVEPLIRADERKRVAEQIAEDIETIVVTRAYLNESVVVRDAALRVAREHAKENTDE